MEALLFKVALFYDKRTYRTIALDPNQTLYDLHDIIFDAFDREEEHLYSFYFPDKASVAKHPFRRVQGAPEYSIPEMVQEGAKDVTKAIVGWLQLKEKQKFYYLFDFGDEWWHEITFVGRKDVDVQSLPAVILKKGESPSQYADCDEEWE